MLLQTLLQLIVIWLVNSPLQGTRALFTLTSQMPSPSYRSRLAITALPRNKAQLLYCCIQPRKTFINFTATLSSATLLQKMVMRSRPPLKDESVSSSKAGHQHRPWLVDSDLNPHRWQETSFLNTLPHSKVCSAPMPKIWSASLRERDSVSWGLHKFEIEFLTSLLESIRPGLWRLQSLDFPLQAWSC